MRGGGAAPPDPAPAIAGPRMRDGKVFTDACELPIVRHCNLSCRSRADAHGVLLRAKQFDRFRESHALHGTEDDALVGRIYRTCNIAHAWSCHNVEAGYFYKCPESLLLPAVLDESRRARLRPDG